MQTALQALLIAVPSYVLGVFSTVLTDRIKAKLSKRDLELEEKAKRQSDRENVHLNVLRDSHTEQTRIGRFTHSSWMVNPHWLFKDAGGSWRIREWTTFSLIECSWKTGTDDKMAHTVEILLRDETVSRAISRMEWLVFKERWGAKEVLAFDEYQPCLAEHAHLFEQAARAKLV